MGKISLRAARVSAGLTLEEVSRITDISKFTLAKYEKGTSSPRWNTFLMLCDLYKQSINDIFIPSK